MAAAAPALLRPTNASFPNTSGLALSTSRVARHAGPYPGTLASVHAEKCIDEASEKPDAAVAGNDDARHARAHRRCRGPRRLGPLRYASDVVGIKVNCSGAPGITSSPEVVAEIVRNLIGGRRQAGSHPDLRAVSATDRYRPLRTLRARRRAHGRPKWSAAEPSLRSHHLRRMHFFDEEDTRSNLIRQVTKRFTKIVNVPNMKDHGAAGVTGCLKNIAYGNFSNVARSHYARSPIRILSSARWRPCEPLRSRTVLQVMDGLRGVWHGGPFLRPESSGSIRSNMLFGTDPVAMDRSCSTSSKTNAKPSMPTRCGSVPANLASRTTAQEHPT